VITEEVGSRSCVAALLTLSLFHGACALSGDVELPAVHQAAWQREPDACVPLPPPPMLPPEQTPSDPRACLSSSWSARGLPVQVSVVDGRVASFDFYDQCSGESFEVAPSVRDCIRRSLSTWRYAVWPTCPSQKAATSHDILHLLPLPEDERLASNLVHGCSG
jgi:hypothetical protein